MFKVSIEMGVVTKTDAEVVQKLIAGLSGLLPKGAAVKTTETPPAAEAGKKASGKTKPAETEDDADDDAGDDGDEGDDDAEDDADEEPAPKAAKGKKEAKAEKPAKGDKKAKAKKGDDAADLNDVRAALAKLAKLQPDGFKKAKKLLAEFGVKDVKELDDENYAQVIEKADEMVAAAADEDGDDGDDDADEMFG